MSTKKRKYLRGSDLRHQCAVHQKRESCYICGEHKTITQAHHVMPLKDVAQIMSRCELTMEEPPVVWLCPNCHAYVHKFKQEHGFEHFFAADELKCIFELDDLQRDYMNRQILRWFYERTGSL